MISVFGSLVGEAEIKAVTECLESQWLGLGRNVDEFEERFKAKFGLPTFAMVDSGSNALLMAVSLLDLPPGSEIILPTYTWVSCAQAIILAGHKPVFCDVDLATMNVRSEDVVPKITKSTAAIMVVHYAGLSVDMDPIKSLGYPIVEDAAHAVDSTYYGQPCGNIGDVGIYSFDAVKNLTVGEGGGITMRDSKMLPRALAMRYCGIGKSGFEAAQKKSGSESRWWEYNIAEPFIKMLPTNIAASIGIAQLDRIDCLQARRAEIWARYQLELGALPQVITPVDAPVGCKHSYFTYCIRVPNRDGLAKFLLENNIYTTLRYHPLHLNPIYGQTKLRLPNSEQLNEDALSIPLHPRLSDDDVSFVISKIKEFYG